MTSDREVKLFQDYERLRKAMEEARVLIGAVNDNAPPAVKESNINAAWHILDSALTPAMRGGEKS